MRKINCSLVTGALEEIIGDCLVRVDPEICGLLETAAAAADGLQAFALGEILENNRIAAEERVPACQDTGLAIVFLDVGQEVRFTGGLINDAVNEGVRRGCRSVYARNSVADPITRKNTGDNTPAIIYTRIVAGDKITVSFLAKGAGSENMNRLYMLPPARGTAGIIECAAECVTLAGANPCPPVILGIGIGGDAGLAAELSKRALLSSVRLPNPDPGLAALEREILAAVNAAGIGVQGLGGGDTCLAVFCRKAPCHIGSLPVFITVQCHSSRHGTRVI
jgi:fumarate hydratase subunit alpha